MSGPYVCTCNGEGVSVIPNKCPVCNGGSVSMAVTGKEDDRPSASFRVVQDLPEDVSTIDADDDAEGNQLGINRMLKDMNRFFERNAQDHNDFKFDYYDYRARKHIIIPMNALFQHYQRKSKYITIMPAVIEATMTMGVVYMNEKFEVFIRPIEEFLQILGYDEELGQKGDMKYVKRRAQRRFTPLKTNYLPAKEYFTFLSFIRAAQSLLKTEPDETTVE